MGVLDAAFGHPWLLLLAPPVLAVLYLLERWRRRPVEVRVADLGLFAEVGEVLVDARARRRRLSRRWLARALAALLLIAAAAGARAPGGGRGPVTVDLVLDAGVSAGVHEREGTRLELHRRHLEAVLSRLHADDRVRVHALPAGAFPPPRPVSPARARELLAAVRPTAARARVEEAARRLAAAAPVPGRVFVATDRPLSVERAAVANAGTRRPNLGIVGLAREDGDLFVALSATAFAARRVEVQLAARGPGGSTTARLAVAVPAEGAVLARWGALPADAREVSARIEPGDALPCDDRAFAVVLPDPPRRVTVVGSPGSAVERALRAVPGVRLVHLAGRDPDAVRRAAEASDLLVLSFVPEVLPPVGVAVVPSALPEAGLLAGGPVRPAAERGPLPFALAALEREVFSVSPVAPPPPGLGSLRPLVRAGEAPLLSLAGRGRRTVAVFGAPLGGGSPWPRQQSFPLLWGELLDLAAPRGVAGPGPLRSWEAGRPPPPGGPAAPLYFVGRGRDAAGRPALGTAAAPLPSDPPPPERGFAADELAAIDAGRPTAPPTSLSPLLALAALLCLGSAWAPAPSASPRAALARPVRADP